MLQAVEGVPCASGLLEGPAALTTLLLCQGARSKAAVAAVQVCMHAKRLSFCGLQVSGKSFFACMLIWQQQAAGSGLRSDGGRVLLLQGSLADAVIGLIAACSKQPLHPALREASPAAVTSMLQARSPCFGSAHGIHDCSRACLP